VKSEVLISPQNFAKPYDHRVRPTYIDFSGRGYLVFINDKQSLLVFDVISKTFIKAIDFHKYLINVGSYSIKINNKLIFLFDHRRKILHQFRIIEGFDISFIRSFELNSVFDWDKYYLAFQSICEFDADSTMLVAPYGIYSEINNFLDVNSAVSINLDTFKCNKNTFFFKNPDNYRSGKVYTTDIYLKFLPQNRVFAGFHSDNYCAIFTRDGTLLSENKFIKKNEFKNFDKTKVRNLAYVRMYQTTNERNRFFYIDSLKKILVIKTMARKKINSEINRAFFLIDEKCNLLGRLDIAEDIPVDCIIPDPKGFYILSTDHKKLIHYDIIL
jgi:hypothetical protein